MTPEERIDEALNAFGEAYHAVQAVELRKAAPHTLTNAMRDLAAARAAVHAAIRYEYPPIADNAMVVHVGREPSLRYIAPTDTGTVTYDLARVTPSDEVQAAVARALVDVAARRLEPAGSAA